MNAVAICLTRVCPHCNQESSPSQTRCSKCGHDLGTITVSNSFLRFITSVLFLGVVAFIAVVAYMLYTGRI